MAKPTIAQASCSSRECQGNYYQADFWMTVASDNGINARMSAETNPGLKSGNILPKGARYHVVGWQYGEKVRALGLNSYDARWYLVEVPGAEQRGFAGSNRWVPAAWVYGDPPNSTPLP